MSPTKLALAVAVTFLATPLAARAAQPEPPAEAAPATGDDVRERALALLGGIDRSVPAEAFRELGPAGEAALEDIALSPELPFHRARALEALALVGSARAEPVHRTLATDRGAPRVVRRAAVRGLGRLVGPAEAPRTLRPFLAADRDPAIRAAAAESLAAVAPRPSCGAIRAQALREDARDRVRFRRALAACERR